MSRFKEEHLAEIDELLKDATENNPDLRPDIYEFTKRLLLWREIAGVLINHKTVTGSF